jgi:hypothetical protein
MRVDFRSTTCSASDGPLSRKAGEGWGGGATNGPSLTSRFAGEGIWQKRPRFCACPIALVVTDLRSARMPVSLAGSE